MLPPVTRDETGFQEGTVRFFAIACVAATALFGAPAVARQWPVRSVRLMVPYPAGGNVDGAARILANKLQENLGQTFTGLFAPAGTPPETVNKIHDALAAILKDPDTVAKFDALGAKVVSMSPAEFRSCLEGEDSKWIPVVRNAKIKID